VVDLTLQAGDAILVPSRRTPGAWILDSATRLLPLVTLITSLVVLKRY